MKPSLFVLVAMCGLWATGPLFPDDKKPDPKDDHPFFALWHDSGRGGGGAPALRFAFWNDGSVVFAKDPAKWGGELHRGRVASYRIDRLKKAISASDIFSLKGNCYLVPSGGVDCLIVQIGEKKQMLYWDEVELAGYGININPKPHHLEFMRCWKQLNSLGLVACPDQSEATLEKFAPGRSWYFKETIQSE
jgi:hypothetical protein